MRYLVSAGGLLVVLLLPYLAAQAQQVSVSLQSYSNNPSSEAECRAVWQENHRRTSEFHRAGIAACDSRFGTPTDAMLTKRQIPRLRCGDEVSRMLQDLWSQNSAGQAACMSAARQKASWDREQRAMQERNEERARLLYREQAAANDRHRLQRMERRGETVGMAANPTPSRQARTANPADVQRRVDAAMQMMGALNAFSSSRNETFESQTDRVHSRAERGLEEVQERSDQNPVISAIQSEALSNIRGIHTDTARQFDQTISSLDQLESVQSASPGPRFNMQGSPDPALTNDQTISSLQALEAAQTEPSRNQASVVASLDALERNVQQHQTVSSLDALEGLAEGRTVRQCKPFGSHTTMANDGDRRWRGERLVECRNGTWRSVQ